MVSLNTKAASRSSQHAGLTHLFSNIQSTPTKTERRLANNFKELYKLTEKGIINRKLLFKFYKDIRKSSTFKPFRNWPKEVLKTTKLEKISSTKKYCTKIIKREKSDLVLKELNKNLTNICFNKFLKLILESNGRNYRYHSIQAHYIGLNARFILNKKNHPEIDLLLTKFRSNEKIHKLYSMMILNHYRANKIAPPSNILKTAYITPEITRFLQTLDLEKYNTQYVFYKEFKKLKEKAFKTVDDKKSTQQQIKTSFNNTLNYLNLTYQHQPKNKALLSLLSISKSLMRRGHYDLARKGYKRILEQSKFHYETTIFENMWSYILENKHEAALNSIKHKDEMFLKKQSKIHFWIGFLNQKIGNNTIATKTFKQIIANNPLSYYSILSAKLLGEKSNKETKDIFLENLPKTTGRKIASKDINKNWLKRVTLWGMVHNPKFLSLELKNISNINEVSLEEHILSAAYNLSTNGQYLESFKVIYKSINERKIKLSENTLKILFPKPYLNQIKRNTKEFDPIIALSLIRQESGFNTNAQSHVGARGLMQLMPNTARQFRKRLKKKHLYNPNLNIRIGTKYFTNLLNTYNNNLVYSLAAYNAGERRVNEWQEDYLNSTFMLKNIENIPFLETRKYVKLIFRNIFFYKMILSNSHKDSQDLNQIYDIHLGFES